MSDLDRILKLASHGTADARSQAPAEREMKEEIPTTEAVGEFADPILDLCDDLGCDSDHPVLGELIRYLDGDTIKDFVADFRRHNDMNHPGEDGDYGDDDENFSEGSYNETKTVCKDCGDEPHNPTTDCPHDCDDENGDHWIEVDVDGDGDADIKIAKDMTEGRLGFKDIAKFGSEKASRIDQEARRRGSADMEPGDADELRYRIAKEMGLISEQFDNTKRDFAPTRNDAIKAQGSAAVMVAKRDYKPPIEVKNIMNDKLKGIIKQKERFAKNISKSAGVDPQATNKMLAKQPTVGAGTNNPFDNMDEDISAMANSRDAVESTYGQIMQGKRGTQPDQSEVGDYIPKGMTPEQIMELIDMLEPQGYDKDFLLKDLADMMQEDEDVIGDIIGKLGKATKAGMKGGRDAIGDIIAKLPKDDEPKRAPGPRVSAVTKQKAANKMAMPKSKPSPKQRGLPRSLAQDTTTPLTQSKFSEWSKK